MGTFTSHSGAVMPLDRADVDTDTIIPKQFMKSLARSGFGDNLFDELRYLDHGEPGQDCRSRPLNHGFVLNAPHYAAADVLLARSNFGCGSSREHAAWAIRDYGFKVLIAPSFADIFYGNCLKTGVLPIVLGEGIVDRLFVAALAQTPYRLHVDLRAQTVSTPDGENFGFEIDALARRCLLEGLDAIALTLEHADDIRTHETLRRAFEPWLFEEPP